MSVVYPSNTHRLEHLTIWIVSTCPSLWREYKMGDAINHLESYSSSKMACTVLLWRSSEGCVQAKVNEISESLFLSHRDFGYGQRSLLSHKADCTSLHVRVTTYFIIFRIMCFQFFGPHVKSKGTNFNLVLNWSDSWDSKNVLFDKDRLQLNWSRGSRQVFLKEFNSAAERLRYQTLVLEVLGSNLHRVMGRWFAHL